jgi:hypothetical protein
VPIHAPDETQVVSPKHGTQAEPRANGCRERSVMEPPTGATPRPQNSSTGIQKMRAT